MLIFNKYNSSFNNKIVIFNKISQFFFNTLFYNKNNFIHNTLFLFSISLFNSIVFLYIIKFKKYFYHHIFLLNYFNTKSLKFSL